MRLHSRRGSGNTGPIIGILVAILLAGGALAVWKLRTPTPDPHFDDAAFKEDRKKGPDSQRDEKWCEAKDAWLVLQAKIPTGDERAPERHEVESNLRIATKRCDAINTGVSAVTLPEKPADRKHPSPAAAQKPQLLDFYPIGRQVRSVGFSNITGQGENTRWFLHGINYFAYQYRVVLETTVKENDGVLLVCEIQFKDVHQIRAVSKQKLELKLPDSPIVQMVFEEVNNELKSIPQYRIAMRAKEVLDPLLDPLLGKIMNSIADTFVKHPDAEIVALFDKFTGLRMRAEYMDGVGVTKLEVLEGRKFKPDDLEELAYNLSLVMDYSIGTVAAAKVGEEKVLRVENLFGMLVTGYDVSPSGKIAFAKTKEASGAEPVELEIRGGDVAVTGRVGGAKRTGTLTPNSGTITYLPDQRLISRAVIDWGGGLDWEPDDNLLFGTSGSVNVKMNTYYEAERIDKPGTASKP